MKIMGSKEFHMLQYKQSGFAAIETLLIVAILAIIGGTGYFVWHAKQNADASLKNAAKSSVGVARKPQSKTSVDAASGLTTFSSANGAFSVQYPSSWVTPSNPKLCGTFLDNDLEIGPDKQSVVVCATDGSLSQVSISATTPQKAGDPSQTLNAQGYKNFQSSDITVDSVKGHSYSAVASGQEEGLGAYPDGAIVMMDVFTKGKWVVIAQYNQLPPSDNAGISHDNRSTFDQIVKSLKFL